MGEKAVVLEESQISAAGLKRRKKKNPVYTVRYIEELSEWTCWSLGHKPHAQNYRSHLFKKQSLKFDFGPK